MKTIAFYLPQFHEISENNEWWEKGYTEWTAVKRAKPKYKGHLQPKIPLNKNYYDLTNKSVLENQSETALKYGVDAFCFYHYWFNGRKLLEMPLEQFRDNPTPQINYCICWANHNWQRTWWLQENKSVDMLIEQTYGDTKEILNHYEYLRTFFLDNRYIKIKNKPVLLIYRPRDIPNQEEYLDKWQELAIKDGFSGICYIFQTDINKEWDKSRFDFGIEIMPDAFSTAKAKIYSKMLLHKPFYTTYYLAIKLYSKLLNIPIRVLPYKLVVNMTPLFKNDEKVLQCVFPGFDDTPRRPLTPRYFKDSSPLLFEKALDNVLKNYNKPFLFINAWNEWGEGAYLEPDEHWKYGYLEALSKCLKKNKLGDY